MKIRLAQFAERLRTNLWVVPSVCTLLALLLALLLIEIDRRGTAANAAVPLAFQGGAESARAILSTIAGSMITVAGVIYSITIVVLTLASIQFAPRVLGNFMRDRSNQFVLGFFVATFTYCLIVMRAIRGSGPDEFVPGAAVTGGIVLALISLAMLIYFIDHIFHGMQVSSIISSVALATREQIDSLYPDAWQPTEAEHSPDLPLSPDEAPVLASGSGYLQFVDYARLLDLATDSNIVVREEHAIGGFIMSGAPMAFVSPSAALTLQLQTQLRDAFAVGMNPTLQQDIGFGVRQIVDIALKAISPAVNDPTTALNCIDHLGAILLALAGRKMPSGHIWDANGNLRIVARERTFADLVRLAFDQIRHYGAGDHVIVLRMLDSITQIASATRNPAYLKALDVNIDRIAATADHRIDDPYEKHVVAEHIHKAKLAVQPHSSPPIITK